MNTRIVTLVLLAAVIGPNLFADDNEPAEWIDLAKEVDPGEDAVAGEWVRTDDGLTTSAVRSARLTLPYQPETEYDFRVTFTRNSGVHSIALMFVVGRGQATFEVDAWGQHLAGLQMIDRRTIQENSTRTEDQTLENGRMYTAVVQVRRGRVRALLDDEVLADYETDGSDLSLPDVWRMPDARSLGIGAYDAATTFHSVEVRPVSGERLIAGTTSRPSGTSPTPRANGTDPAGSKQRVLIVIANQDFFYREYHDPREQLEEAGIIVEVAAARREVCRPHANSGQEGSGEVMPDLAIADVDAARYDAIMFSGGWGASTYQYAFEGTYVNRAYNGDRQTRAAVNRLLNEFVAQDKYIGGLCHGVSVLAWARVDGKSLLDGRRAVASPRQSPAGAYNGRRDQPLSRWNAEVNGARLSPARSIGDPRTSADDVLVDGRLITGEDDNSAELFGATLARLLAGAAD